MPANDNPKPRGMNKWESLIRRFAAGEDVILEARAYILGLDKRRAEHDRMCDEWSLRMKEEADYEKIDEALKNPFRPKRHRRIRQDNAK